MLSHSSDVIQALKRPKESLISKVSKPYSWTTSNSETDANSNSMSTEKAIQTKIKLSNSMSKKIIIKLRWFSNPKSLHTTRKYLINPRKTFLLPQTQKKEISLIRYTNWTFMRAMLTKTITSSIKNFIGSFRGKENKTKKQQFSRMNYKFRLKMLEIKMKLIKPRCQIRVARIYCRKEMMKILT